MRGRTVGRLALLFVASVVAVAVLGASAWSQAPLDPQSLIGDWNGSWTNKKAQGVNGQYHLRIEQVNGNKVYGQVEFSGPPNRAIQATRHPRWQSTHVRRAEPDGVSDRGEPDEGEFSRSG